jgi:hypothetical protein
MLGSDFQPVVRFLHRAQRLLEIAVDQPITTGSACQAHALEAFQPEPKV